MASKLALRKQEEKKGKVTCLFVFLLWSDNETGGNVGGAGAGITTYPRHRGGEGIHRETSSASEHHWLPT